MRAVVVENKLIELKFHHSVYDEIVKVLEIPVKKCIYRPSEGSGKEYWNMGFLLDDETLFRRVRRNYETMMGCCDFIDDIYNGEYDLVEIIQ